MGWFLMIGSVVLFLLFSSVLGAIFILSIKLMYDGAKEIIYPIKKKIVSIPLWERQVIKILERAKV